MSEIRKENTVVIKQGSFSLEIEKSKEMPPSVYKVHLGSKYFIWKGKSLSQSCDILCKSISATLSRIERGVPIPDTDYLYHVVKHLRLSKRRVGTVEVISNGFVNEFGEIDAVELLKEEQRVLDTADGDADCLNNNCQAYIPISNAWISEKQKHEFLKWYPRRRK